MTKMVLTLAIIIGSTLWTVLALAQSLPLMPGYYEVTATMSTSSEPEQRHRCVTAEHLANAEAVLNYAFAKKFTPLPNHKIMNFSVGGDKISYEVDTPFSLIHVEGTISDTNFSVMRSNKSKSGKVSPIPMTLTLIGKRTGDCKGK
ncbi:MAG: hypothetical protein JSR31_07440 [Nitrospira sp.]|nr:hypothetical protein [Nitrospira sp.]